MAFELPKLPYEFDALEPHINKQTVEVHYTKHHNAYVNKTNGLAEGTEFENASLEEIIKKADGTLFNNGAQVWNHTFYWESLSPDGGGEPTGRVKELIDKKFGSFDNFKDKFTVAAAGLFGSGWTWLVQNKSGDLKIVQKSNAENPLRDDENPILTIDVWEHAYYLDYKNKRPDYIKAFWNLINWKKVEERLK